MGEYLRARRELVRPEDVGFRDLGRRRTPGLRREEVAMLAGVSADYYIRLEQGRDQHPSPQVLDALARALKLDEDATAHLHGLAQPSGQRRRRGSRPERAPAAITQLIMSWPATPAYVFGRYLDVLAANPLATALAPWFTVGENLVKGAFLDPRRRELRPDWERSLTGTVAALRANVGADTDDPRLTTLVGELSLRSEEFRQLWARHDARPKGSGTSVMHQASDPGHRPPDPIDLPRRAGQPERAGARPAGHDHSPRARTRAYAQRLIKRIATSRSCCAAAARLSPTVCRHASRRE